VECGRSSRKIGNAVLLLAMLCYKSKISFERGTSLLRGIHDYDKYRFSVGIITSVEKNGYLN